MGRTEKLARRLRQRPAYGLLLFATLRPCSKTRASADSRAGIFHSVWDTV
jgi:hypothetical protein